MQYRATEGSDGPEMSPQSSVVTPSFGSQPSHRPASDSNPEISPQHPDTRLLSHLGISDHRPTLDNQGAPRSSPMSVSPPFPSHPQMQNNQPMPATLPMPHTILPPYPPAEPPLPSAIVPLTDNQEKEVVIAVMGVTGTGKSHFIREVSGISDVEVSSGLHSCTTKVQPYYFPYANVKVTLVDTPGFNDTAKSDTEVLTDICAWISSNYKKGKRLSGIIYFHRITDVRIDGTSLKNFKILQKMCGPDALQNVLLTTTQWSNVNPALGEEREGNLRHDDFWGELISQHASLERFMGTRESGLELISKLIEKEPKPLHIQDEMVKKGMTLAETNVGKFVNEELISLQKKYEKDLENLEREHQNATKEGDGEMEMILAQEQANIQEKLEEAAAERKLLANLQEVQMGKLEEALRKRDEERAKEDRAVIAVNLKDIQFKRHIISLLIPHSTKGLGRLIHDVDDTSEFEKAPFDVTIDYQFSPSFVLGIVAEKLSIFDSEGTSGRNQIIYNNSIYLSEPGGPIERGTQKFRIFTKY